MSNYDDQSSAVDGGVADSAALPDARFLARFAEVMLPTLGEQQPLDLDAETRASWNLKRIRQALDLSQQQLADRLAKKKGAPRLSQSQIAKMERGERPWRLNELFSLAQAMNVSWIEFFSNRKLEDDPLLKIEAARLRLVRSLEHEIQVQQEVSKAKLETYDAEDLVIFTCAELGIKHPAAMSILRDRYRRGRHACDPGYEPKAEDPEMAKQEIEERALQFADKAWESYLKEAKTRMADGRVDRSR
ncbi:helix-turn-helix domain-containing protein [Streptomyces sp. NPDC059979]|uniref:helix-turn-helix domain-containing protein n=1 Tax=Streptomyces sp. NPDC059979 TaxID=3347021 RepID=UPI0036AB186F